MTREKSIAIVAIATFILCCMLSHSCANTTTPPSGGPKDTIPPVLLKVTPDVNTTGFPTIGGTVTLLFNEYTVVKNQQDIYLSPPVKKKPKSKIKGKNLIIMLQDTLREDQTYTLDFGQALADNNEGNLAPRMVYTFSTGDVIDSMYVTGKLIDCKTLMPVASALVALYSDHSDSACFLSYPDAASKTDEWGFFSIRNIRPLEYRVIAFTDKDGDSKYNPDEDNVAFMDSVFTPDAVVRDSIFELGFFDMKDTLLCQLRQPMMELSMFKELQTRQYLQNSGRPSEKVGFLKFSAADVQINSLDFMGIDKDDVALQFNPTHDSLTFWITSRYKLDDSLMVRVNYMKTDSTGVLAPFEENLSLAIDKPESTGTAATPTPATAKRTTNEPQQPDTVFNLKVSATGDMVEQNGITLETEFPIVEMMLDSIALTETNPKNQISSKKIDFSRDTTDIRKFILTPDCKLLVGYTYEVSIPQGTFTNMYGLPNKAEKVKFELPNDDNLSSIKLIMKNVDSRYIIELTNEKGDKCYRKYFIDNDCSLMFPYLKGGDDALFSIRITQDRNRNGIFDTGNLLERRQPEKVLKFEFSPGEYTVQLPEKADIEQDIDIKKMFR